MSSVRYKRAKNEREDEQNLAMNEEIDDAVELQDMRETTAPTSSVENYTSAPQVIYKSDKRKQCYLGWAVLSTVLLLSIIVISILSHHPPRGIVWCCIGQDEVEKCHNLSLELLYSDFEPQITCKLADTADKCVHLIDKDQADVFSVDTLLLFKYRNLLKPLMAESDTETGLGQYLLAISSNSDNTTVISQESFKTKKACVGNWNVFGGFIANISGRQYSKTGCKSKFYAGQVFPNVCAPDTNTLKLCKGCKGEVCKKPCNSDNFCGFDGAMSCLIDSGDEAIAFTTSGALKKALSKSRPTWAASFKSEDYGLLCPNGSRASLSDYESCNLGWMPGRSLVLSKKIRTGSDIEVPSFIMELMLVSQLYFGSHVITTNTSMNMFESPPNKPNLMFPDSTASLVPLRLNCTAEAYLGLSYSNMLHAVNCSGYGPEMSYPVFSGCYLPQYAHDVPTN